MEILNGLVEFEGRSHNVITQIYDIEHNLKSPSVETLAKLCDELVLVVSVTEK